MSKTSETGPTRAEVDELTLLFEQRTFVDYFNTYLCLPVFGQHVFYNYTERDFVFEPPIKNWKPLCLDRREIIRWLYTDRFLLFKKTALYTEYKLCMLLKNSIVKIPGLKLDKEQDADTFKKNVIGTVVGMMLFRESMRGTCGENVYRCWKDIEAWKGIEDPARNMYWKHVIKSHYIGDISRKKVSSKFKVKVFSDKLNFDLVPDNKIHQQLLNAVTNNNFHSSIDSHEALLKLQTILLDAFRKYWLPRHLLHIVKTVKTNVLNKLKKPIMGDMENIDHERMLRRRYMFPTIYQDSNIPSPATTGYVSQTADDHRRGSSMSSLSAFSDEDLEDSDERISPSVLLSLWGGPTKEIDIERLSSTTSSSSLPEIDSPIDGNDDERKHFSADTVLYVKSPIPIVLTSFVGGKKRTALGNLPNMTNRVIWSLASDELACCPFRDFLQQNEEFRKLQYLGFWTDVRNYLDADENADDGFGRPVKPQLANRITDIYLSKDAEKRDIFSEKLKTSLYTAINTNDDISLLCMAQDIIQAHLWEPLKSYILEERRQFRKRVWGQRRQLNRKQRQVFGQSAKISNLKSANAEDCTDPLYCFNCEPRDADSGISSPISTSARSASRVSRASAAGHVTITEAQLWKAMELAVLCSEYGVSMMLPKKLPQPSLLVDVLRSDYGSLHMNKVTTVRNEWLRTLTEKRKINIETVKVSTEFLMETIDLAELKKNMKSTSDDIITQKDSSKRPTSLMDVLVSHELFESFKRFMTKNKMIFPVLFWKAVEDLLEVVNPETRKVKVTQILRKYFGRYAKYGAALDCHDEIIYQIPIMDEVTADILMCAQAAVFRSLERKWFPMFVDTLPPDPDSSNVAGSLPPGIKRNFVYIADVITKNKKSKKRYVDKKRLIASWKKFTTAFANFTKTTSFKSGSQLFEMFLKYEVERDKYLQRPQKELPGQAPQIEKNIMMSNVNNIVQTSRVVRNTFVIMNRLPQDLRFWIEINKYQYLVDSISKKGDLSDKDEELLNDKAKSIISCFLASAIAPRVQVNIPDDMATLIIDRLSASGPKRGLFHDALIQIFPIISHFYEKFSDEWMKGNIPDDYFDFIEHALRGNVAQDPHPESNLPDFTSLDPSEIKQITSLLPDEDTVKISFSISGGVVVVYPNPLINQRRRKNWNIINAINEQIPLNKEDHGDGKNSKHALTVGDKTRRKKDETGRKTSTGNIKEKKKKEKIEIQTTKEVSAEDSTEKKVSNDNAQRISQLLESLNRKKEELIKEQNKQFSNAMTMEHLISALRSGSFETKSVNSQEILNY